MVRTSHVYRERPPDEPNETEESGFGSEIGDFAKNGHLYAPVTAAKQSQSAMDYLELPLNSCRQLWAATKPLQTTANRHKIATKPLQMAATVIDYLRLPPTPLNYRRLPRPTARLPQSRPDRYHAPANYAGRISKPPQQFNDNLCKDKNLKAIHTRIKVTIPGQLRFYRNSQPR